MPRLFGWFRRRPAPEVWQDPLTPEERRVFDALSAVVSRELFALVPLGDRLESEDGSDEAADLIAARIWDRFEIEDRSPGWPSPEEEDRYGQRAAARRGLDQPDPLSAQDRRTVDALSAVVSEELRVRIIIGDPLETATDADEIAVLVADAITERFAIREREPGGATGGPSAIGKRSAQHIGLWVSDWNARGPERFLGVNVARVLPDYDDSAFPLLGTVEDYETTVFDRSRLPDVRSEWMRLRAGASPDQAATIDQALRAIDEVLRLGEDHRLIFEGD
jgi:hypothetical protein